MRYTLGHPLVDAAIDDQRLGAIDLRAFRVLWAQLDFQEFREKKSEVLGAEIGADRSNSSRALRNLVAFGYLEEGPPSAKGIGMYRLARGVPSGGQNIPTSAPAPRVRRQIRSSL